MDFGRQKNNNQSPLFLVPGNHDVSNAIGFYEKMSPAKDATSMAEIFNRTMNLSVLRTKGTYSYDKEKVFYKGLKSASDPGKLSFQVTSINEEAKTMTVREYLWNTKTWGETATVSLTPRSK